MLQTVEAIIDVQGRVRLLETVKIGKPRKALVTILDEEEISSSSKQSIVGTVEILSDLESASAEIAEMFNSSIENTAKKLED